MSEENTYYTSPQPDMYEQQNTLQSEEPKGKGFGIASMVLGVVSLVLTCCMPIITAVLAVIFGIVHLVQKRPTKGFAISGIITGGISLIITIMSLTAYIGTFNMVENELGSGFWDALRDYISQEIDEGEFEEKIEDYINRIEDIDVVYNIEIGPENSYYEVV